VLGDSLAHGSLFLEATLLVELGADTVNLLGKLGTLVDKASFLFALALFRIKPSSVQLCESGIETRADELER
jgi:hypothetical protein